MKLNNNNNSIQFNSCLFACKLNNINIINNNNNNINNNNNNNNNNNHVSQVSAVGIATGYGLDDRGVGVRFPVGLEFSLLHIVQTGCGAHPASCPTGTVDSFRGGKAAGV
jgi:hypothetical protein